MNMPVFETNHDLFILEEIENNPCTTQACIAEKLNAAVGTVNWHIKRFVESDCVKIQHSEKRKSKYIITPKGSALRDKLMQEYINNSLQLYRSIRERMKDITEKLEKENQTAVFIDGSGDVYDICRLSCLEKNITVLEQPDGNTPTLIIEDVEIICAPDEIFEE